MTPNLPHTHERDINILVFNIQLPLASLTRISLAAQCFPSLPEMQSKQGDLNNAIFAAAKKAISPSSSQASNLFQDLKANKENWSTALSEQASSAKMQSPTIATLASRALSSNLPLTKGILPLPLQHAVTNVTPSSLCLPQLVSTTSNTSSSDGLITVTPLYTMDGRNVIVHKSIPSTPTLQVPNISTSAVITSMAASLLSAACKQPLPTNIPTVGQLLQTNQLLACSQKN